MLKKEHWTCAEQFSREFLCWTDTVICQMHLMEAWFAQGHLPGQNDFMVGAPWLAPCLGPLSGQVFYWQESPLALSFSFTMALNQLIIH